MSKARCTKCGEEITLLKNQTAVHAACPKRGPRSEAPVYKLVEEAK